MTAAASSNTDPKIAIPDLERAWMDAWIAKDAATCDRIIDDDFLLSSARGVLMPKEQWLSAAMGPFTCRTFEWLEVLVRPFGEVALAHSMVRQHASVGDQDWSGVFMLTDVWILRDDGWRVVSRHGTGPLKA
jgi:ketosteroid isomerase-like protein